MNLATPPPGATLGLHKPMYPMPPPPQQQYPLPPGASGNGDMWRSASPLFVNPMLVKGYQQLMERQMGMMQQPTEVLMVSPGMPTPLELSIYEVKQPTGFLHVTAGNQTVEFLDGVANMPRKR